MQLTIKSDELAETDPCALFELVQLDTTIPPCSLDDALKEPEHTGRDAERST